jgi:hypothetical protein
MSFTFPIVLEPSKCIIPDSDVYSIFPSVQHTFWWRAIRSDDDLSKVQRNWYAKTQPASGCHP